VASGSSGGATSIDVQGFIYWDPTEVTSPGHNYSGWELHPFTAWRLSASLATTIEDSANNPVASIMAGTTVHDTSIVSGGSGVYTGTVTYSLFTGSTCSGTGTVVGSPVIVTTGVVPDSASQTFSTAGSFSWNALYSGDANNGPALSACEPLFVNKASPTLTTSLLSNPITRGGSTADSATLANGVQAGGTVTYNFFTGPSCSGTVTPVGSPVVVTSGVVPDSASQIFNAAGSFSWTAVYSGDANNNGADSPCEPLTVNPSIMANFAFSPTNSAPGQKVIFSGSATGGTPPYESWSWNFGDNSSPGFEATVAHSYSKAGSYTVQLTVTDSTGINATSTATIIILEKRTIVGLDPTFFYELTTSLGVAVAITALGLYWKRT